MKIILPNNGLGVLVMLTAITLIATVPLVVTLWLMLKIAPAWVAIPVAISVAFLVLLLTVKLPSSK